METKVPGKAGMSDYRDDKNKRHLNLDLIVSLVEANVGSKASEPKRAIEW